MTDNCTCGKGCYKDMDTKRYYCDSVQKEIDYTKFVDMSDVLAAIPKVLEDSPD